MVNYTCPRCGYSINIKTKYVKHLRRKTLCPNKKSNNNLREEYIKYNIIEKISLKSDIYAKSTEKYAKSTEKYAKSTEKYAKSTDSNYDDSESIDTEEGYLICKECDQTFDSKDKLELHLKKKM